MTAPPGAIVSLYLDTIRPVAEGNVIETQSGRVYRAVHVRQQQTGKHTGRWHLKALVITPDDVNPDTDHIIRITWYRRQTRKG